jgi:hypothetical protein
MKLEIRIERGESRLVLDEETQAVIANIRPGHDVTCVTQGLPWAIHLEGEIKTEPTPSGWELQCQRERAQNANYMELIAAAHAAFNELCEPDYLREYQHVIPRLRTALRMACLDMGVRLGDEEAK